jgi:hypothetical protein
MLIPVGETVFLENTVYVSLVKKGVDLEKKRLDREERQRQIKIKEI